MWNLAPRKGHSVRGHPFAWLNDERILAPAKGAKVRKEGTFPAHAHKFLLVLTYSPSPRNTCTHVCTTPKCIHLH